MKNLRFAVAILSIGALASCSNTIAGMSKDAVDVNDWANNRPSTLGRAIGDAPTGYGEQPTKSVMPAENTENSSSVESESEAQSPHSFKSARTSVQPASSPIKSSKLVWHKIDHYNAENPALSDGEDATAALPSPQTSSHKSAPVQIVEYNRSVNVFPVDGDMTPYMQVNSVDAGSVGGEMVQQVFFEHGSAKIGRMDHKNLHELARSLVHNNGDYKLNVVGHASKRVNHVRDPIEKRMINFKMAQRRANAVANDLLQAGLSPSWVIATSMGDEQSNARRNGKSQEAADRRAEVFLSTN